MRFRNFHPVVLIILMSSFLTVNAQSTVRLTLPSSGYIEISAPDSDDDWVPEDATLVFETSFEDAKKVDDHELTLVIPHRFNYAGKLYNPDRWVTGEDGARFWVESNLAHTGTKCIGLEVHDITKARRNELTITDAETFLGDEYWISIWDFLPADWGMHTERANLNWYNIFTPLASDKNAVGHWCPKIEIQIIQPTQNVPRFHAAIHFRDYYHSGEGHSYYLAWYKDFPLPRGRWFEIRVHLIRGTTDGAIQVWIDGILVGDVGGIPTIAPEEPNLGYDVCIAKIYHDEYDYTVHRLWIDDLKIWKR